MCMYTQLYVYIYIYISIYLSIYIYIYIYIYIENDRFQMPGLWIRFAALSWKFAFHLENT